MRLSTVSDAQYGGFTGLARAVGAARTAQCALEQGMFWEVHDWFYQDPKYLDPAVSAAFVKRLRIDQRQFERCFDAILANRPNRNQREVWLVPRVSDPA